jgi:hypothetical protein
MAQDDMGVVVLVPTIDVVGADVAEDKDCLPTIRVLLDVKGEHDLEGRVAFPDAGMALHLSYAQ